jgi:hypothetical protein
MVTKLARPCYCNLQIIIVIIIIIIIIVVVSRAGPLLHQTSVNAVTWHGATPLGNAPDNVCP